MLELWSLRDDWRKCAQFIYPWGQSNTPLHNLREPRKWQIEEFEAISDHIRRNKERVAQGLTPLPYFSSTASGRGIGKSAYVSMISDIFRSTRIGSTTIITANSESQLKSRTWAESGKWHTMAINNHWWERNTLSCKPAPWFDELLKKQLKIDTGYYYTQAQLWREENPDAFAGVHSTHGIMLVMDEASGIPEPIWRVSEGFFTDPIMDRFWFVFSNPRRNTGAFYECFHRNVKSWRTRHIDSRSVEGVDKAYLDGLIEKYGIDSDPARVEVLGQFPRTGDSQLISREWIKAATERELVTDPFAPLIMGIDVARFGDDRTVFRWRQGRDGRTIRPVKVKGLDTMAVANLAAQWIQKTNPDAVCIDAGGAGAGVIDRLRQMGYKVHEIWFGAGADDPKSYRNKRVEMWCKARDWLISGGCIDKDQEFMDDLAGPEYKLPGAGDAMALESKAEMKARGLSSPDDGDAFVVTFGVHVPHRDLKAHRARFGHLAGGNFGKVATGTKYNPFKY